MSNSTPFTQNLSQVIFERNADYPSGLLAPSIFLIFAFGFLMLAFLRRKPIEAQFKFLRNNTTFIPNPPLCLKIAGFITILGLAGSGPQVWGWWTLRQDLQQEKINVIEGVLTKAETWQTKGRRTEDTV